jgi:ABC-type sugar transport system permease subunit
MNESYGNQENRSRTQSAIRQRLWHVQTRSAPYLFVLPFVLLFGCFFLYPLGRSLLLSAQMSAGPRLIRFTGLANYRFILKDVLFWIALANTLGFALVFLCIQIPMSLGLAMLLNSRRVQFRGVLRLVFFSPFLIGPVFVAIVFMLLLAPRQGLINQFIAALLPWIGSEINWKSNPNLALPAIILASLWLCTGYGMIYLLAALQAVDTELYEAALIDGAGRWARFRHITLPSIRPVLSFLVLIGTVNALQLFELPYVFFQGPGPRLRGLFIVTYLWGSGFDMGDLGFASAVGWILVLLIAFVAAIEFKLTKIGRRTFTG